VTVSTEAIIDAAATFFAYGNIACSLLSSNTDSDFSREPWEPAGALLVAAGLAQDTNVGAVPNDDIKAQLDIREHDITTELLERIAEAVQRELANNLRVAHPA